MSWSRIPHLISYILHLTSYTLLIGCTPKSSEGMVLVPAGPFVMGTDEVELEEAAQEYGIAKPWVLDATPAHRVNLPAFGIQSHEVTNAEYLRFVEAREFSRLPHWPSGRPTPEQERLPVVYVDWEEAQAYCHWIGGRLPTEEEWEKGARGPDGRLYPWGDAFDDRRANVGGLYPRLLTIGSLPEGMSPYGLFDMIGNVWEWTDSWYQPYPQSRYSTAEYGERYRVVRGNSFGELGHFPPDIRKQVIAAQARAAYRLFLPPNAAIEDLGFRCAQSKE